LIGDLAAPGQRLAIQILEAGEGPRQQEVGLDIKIRLSMWSIRKGSL
jgi:hypothetical protein